MSGSISKRPTRTDFKTQWFLFAKEADNTPYLCSGSADITAFTKKKKNTFSINIDNEGIKNSNDKKLLGVHLNNKPDFGL